MTYDHDTNDKDKVQVLLEKLVRTGYKEELRQIANPDVISGYNHWMLNPLIPKRPITVADILDIIFILVSDHDER